MTNEQVESMFRAIAESIAHLDTKLESINGRLDGIDGRLDGIDGRLDGIDGRLDGIDGRLTIVELGQEQMRRDICGVADGVSLLLERREEDEVWRAEITARVLKLEAEVHDIKRRLLTA